MSNDNKRHLLVFFTRPQEPCFLPKGKGGEKVAFELPDHYYPDKYKEFIRGNESQLNITDKTVVSVKNIALPDLSLPLELPFNAHFSLFIPAHQEMAGRLIDIFVGMRDVDDLISVASYCQLRINPYMFNYCLSVAILHRADTKELGSKLPTFAETFPDKFFGPEVFRKAKESTIFRSSPPPKTPLPTAADWDKEERCWYFREDLGTNLHHWHWHLVYPFSGNIKRVDKDRRGELFYYMHHQIIARYNTERLCNGLRQVKPYDDYSKPIVEGYFPKLTSVVADRAWPPRFKNVAINNLNRGNMKMEVSQMVTWYDRIKAAIETLSVKLPDGSSTPLDEKTGIDVLGNLVEASILSKNSKYYGNLHNMGHVFIAYCHDPDGRYLEEFAVMADTATAMRDPVFCRWHKFLDDLFQLYKSKLAPYGNEKLDYPGVRCSGVNIQGRIGSSANTLNTRWDQSTIDIDRGLDFSVRNNFPVSFKHLQHDEFLYLIDVNNTTGAPVKGTVRIFVAPTHNEDGQAFSFEEQRKIMIEMDKFTVTLKPGEQTIRQQSTKSSVTIPFSQTFSPDPSSSEPDFCRCGWPQHMLVPKGTKEGYPMVLFVMISNWKDDKIEQDLTGKCDGAASFCGVQDRLFPDKRAMGFPFDRRAPEKVHKLSDFLTPNMATREISVKFTGENDV